MKNAHIGNYNIFQTLFMNITMFSKLSGQQHRDLSIDKIMKHIFQNQAKAYTIAYFIIAHRPGTRAAAHWLTHPGLRLNPFTPQGP